MMWAGALRAKRQLEMMDTISLHHWAYKLQKSVRELLLSNFTDS